MGPGFAIFVLFFGVSLLDGIAAGHWGRALFFAVVGGIMWKLSLPDRSAAPRIPRAK